MTITLKKFKRSKGDGEWTVLLHENGKLSCDCPSWRYKVGKAAANADEEIRECKHTVAVREEYNDDFSAKLKNSEPVEVDEKEAEEFDKDSKGYYDTIGEMFK